MVPLGFGRRFSILAIATFKPCIQASFPARSLKSSMQAQAMNAMPGENHFIADVAMDVDAVASAFESLGIRYRRRSHG